jgi:hypothetical protein
LLDLLFLRLKKNVEASKINIIISYNEINYGKIQSFLRERKYYGFDKGRFRYVEVECLPVLDLEGQYCINENYKLVKRPFGTVRSVIEIMKSKICGELKS